MRNIKVSTAEDKCSSKLELAKMETRYVFLLNNQDYMGGSFTSAFVGTRKDVEGYIKAMLAWSGNISIITACDTDLLTDKFFSKHGIDEEWKQEIMKRIKYTQES